ncbi:MAG TPA: 16S rRNA (cytidine(1402)-2'-O)-methyltransferase [Planctomycetota bacterium]|nr:16S rRNA (cytidine(1402)-2'-O)-methyltransferase [Planctomycetota bacterium]
MPGTLHVVATPIGNLEDVTLRALRVLGEVDAIACEDTRTTAKLLARHSIRTPLVALFGRSGAALLDRLKQGGSIALVSESGTPGISDPGADLVAAAHEAGAKVTVVPGPCAMAAAAGASGLSADRFLFEGFLPKKPGKRRRLLESLAREPRTLIFYESPHRVAATLEAMREALGDRRLTIARELTKVFEEIRPTSISAALASLDKRPPRGEYVLVVEGAPKARRTRTGGEEE